jgi:beta-mannosidase
MATLKNYFFKIAILLLVLASCQTKKTLYQRDLSADWQFKAIDSKTWLTARVPGVIHTDLLANNLIPDPFIGTNEDSVQWLENEQWEYRTSFSLTEDERKFAKIDLVFDGLDTYAAVYLNGIPILETNNMFRQWRTAVKDDLVAGDNELRVVFTSPIEKNKTQFEQMAYALPAGSETGEWQVSPFTRKAGYQFGWDFAPRLVTMGIWQPVHLDFWDLARIEDVRLELNNLSTTMANYTVYLAIYSAADNTKCQVQVLNSELEINLNAGYTNVAIDISISNPKLWWPNGLGEAYLYDIPIKILSDGQVLDSLSKRLGVRTVELVQDFDSLGKAFYFKVNNEKVFAKGANWSPLSSFPSAIPDSTYVNRLKSVKEANMNMLRVWGGGIYERDLFYDLCDENGIMIWQDFMFANSMYPGDEVFVENVREEVRQQVNRLQVHPSIVLWNGNNEIEVAWKNWGWQAQYGYSASDSAKIWLDYEHLFQQYIPEIINIYDQQRPYTSTSPLSNWGHPDNFYSGSMHYWGVWHGGDSFADYKTKVGRFMAEYGFQSFPGAQTVAFYAGEAELNLDSPSAHQKSYVGNNMITREIDKNFGNQQGFQSFLYKSQQTQALAYKIAIEAHRINKNICGGTLFWQLNDCWPGPSWSVIDYFGRKKQAYDVVKDRYKAVILVADSRQNDFSINVVNDLLEEMDATLSLELFKHDNERLWATEKPILLNSNTVTTVYRSDIRKLLDGMQEQEVYLKLTLKADGEILDIEKFYFVKPKDYIGEYDLIGVE